MTAKDLKKLSRRELIELLLKQTRELEQVKKQLAEKEEKLSDRDMHSRNAGSIAEAAIGLSGVFEAAQRAADEYLNQIKNIDPKELQQ